ncbi:hypothetical protein [Nocardia sp. CA-290969]|uniref:hypothetical protein n=1 Tax=Nocardia sp. CA-290969 TaxID=3239986 RepID=UPI003D90DBA4
MTTQDWQPGRVAAEKALQEASIYSSEIGGDDGDLTHADFGVFHKTITTMLSGAQTHALLAIETRLGELVEQQRISNAIAGVQLLRGYNHAELNEGREKVREIVRDLLDLAPKTETTPATEAP